jgi:predicted short-subunit dehydrogenase-like oxidoreductase (DUF2520 family)
MDPIKNIVIIGAGNVGSHLARHFHAAGFTISQVAGRHEANVIALADEVKASYTLSFKEIIPSQDLYIVALPDKVIEEILPQLPLTDELLVHTSGSVPLEILSQFSGNTGVLYPLQTFSKDSETDISKVPVLIEANRIDNENKLLEAGRKLSEKVLVADSEMRQTLHLAAVFASNFSNHMYDIARRILDEYKLDFDLLTPLIRETAAKASKVGPAGAQTGPAKRKDMKIIEKHLALLDNNKDARELYKKISESIIEQTK